MEPKTVSIIIPTYNYGHLIAETLICLQEQSYPTWEAIIIDDGSTDDTETVVKAFTGTDKRFSYIKQSNKGVSIARNLGLSLVKGDYIQFLDADDLLSKEKIGLQTAFLNANPDVGISLVATWFFDNSDKQRKRYTDFGLKNETAMPEVNGSGYRVISDYVRHNLSVIQSPLFRKEILQKVGRFREGMAYLEDWDFWFRIAISGVRFTFLNNEQAFVLVRVHQVSATQQSKKIIEAEGVLRSLFNEYITKSELTDAEKKELRLKNHKLLIATFKDLMARTSYLNVGKFVQYFKEMKSGSAFAKALIKSINLKRKLMRKPDLQD